MKWGVAVTPNGGPFCGAEISVMRTYGFPLEFDTFGEAQAYLDKFYPKAWKPRVVPMMTALSCVKKVVEVYSGKLCIENGKFVPNRNGKDRPGYDELLPILTRGKYGPSNPVRDYSKSPTMPINVVRLKRKEELA